MIELKRAFTGRSMLLALAAGLAVVTLHMTQVIPLSQMSVERKSALSPSYPHSLYRFWLGYDMSEMAGLLFLFLLPLLAALPFGASLFDDRRSGYDINVVTRAPRGRYYRAKAVAVFVSAGVAVAFPLLLDLCLTAMFLPAIRPEATVFGIPETGMWSGLFYEHPLVYVLAYVLVNFLWAGSIGLMSVVAGYIVANRILVVATPFIILWVAEFALAAIPEGAGSRFSPMELVNAHQTTVGIGFGAMAVEWLVVTALAAGFVALRSRVDESL
ncbi:hypothetical protein GCM10009785_32190 [Brooklawnia cerclae]|uniref:ABC-2 family transporter protein n=1 Tax=Brooklawnia cerclae TaxID=349934 RepID=A0ABX0SH15_9ACTN|nr:hypothetical protein [Brooklawnia cerclae]NIH56490.1 hypothetical protein [Brooklawnia cerclae]